MMKLNVNSNALAAHANTLEKIAKSALPNAIRIALNSAAFDVKQNEMPQSADKTFTKRTPNFFKANSKVEQARGSNVNTMKATVGFVSLSGTNKAVDDLEQQEEGGKIGGRSFVPLPGARTGNNWNKNVRAANRISAIKNKIVDARKSKGHSAAQKFTKAAVHAGKGGIVLGNKIHAGGNRVLWQVRSINRKKGNTTVKMRPLYILKKNRSVTPPATHFMRKASLKSADRLEEFFIRSANAQLKKMYK